MRTPRSASWSTLFGRLRSPRSTAAVVVGLTACLAVSGSIPGIASALTGWGALPTPTVTAQWSSSTTVVVTFSSVDGAQKFDIDRVTGTTYRWIGSIKVPATSYTVRNQSAKNAHCFAANALTNDGSSFSKMSAPACVAPYNASAVPATAAPTTAAPTTTSTTTTTAPPDTTTTVAPPVSASSIGSGGANGLHVSGTSIIDSSGNVVQLRGVNRPGLEYACSQMNQFISDPWSAGANGVHTGVTQAYADTVTAALLSWDKAGTSGHAVNTVRLPLNEECWLGINGAPAAYSGANYQAFVKRIVDNLSAQNVNVVLALHWGAPGSWLPGKDENGNSANGQNLAPNEDHSVTFWQQVASTFKGDGNVIFDLFTEPGISCNPGSGCPDSVLNGGYAAQDEWAWNLYRDGGSYTYNAGNGSMYASRVGQTFQVAGTQQLVDTIRGTGSNNVIAVETLGFGNGYIDMMGNHMPIDPQQNLLASIHTYDFSGFNGGSASNQASLDAQLKTGLDVNYNQVANITGRYPFYIGEFGTTGSCPGTNTDWVNQTMAWADSHSYSYTAWGWDQGEGCWGPTLVTGDDSGAATPFGTAVQQHLQSLQG